MIISLIVAMARNRVIGRDNALPWRLPADLARFKQLTMGCCLIMGRRTWESIGRILPGRTMIVLSREARVQTPGVVAARSLDEALSMCSGDQAFVAGGASVFREGLQRAARVYLTLIDADIPGDTYFPEFDESAWRETFREAHSPDERNPFPYTFLIYERKTMKKIIATTEAPAAIGPYSQAVAFNGLLFLSGQIALDAAGKLIEGDVAAQTEQVLKNLSAILKAAGTDLSKVLKTTVYLKDMNEFTRMNEVYARFFTSEQPARATVEVCRLPRDVRVEIEAIAAL